jgi:hypothetical protein
VASVVSSDGVGCAISDNLKVPTRQSKETWIEDWIQTVEEMVELDLKTESSAKRDFYDINVQINESNAILCRYQAIGKIRF